MAFASLNVNGLRDANKRMAVLSGLSSVADATPTSPPVAQA